MFHVRSIVTKPRMGFGAFCEREGAAEARYVQVTVKHHLSKQYHLKNSRGKSKGAEVTFNAQKLLTALANNNDRVKELLVYGTQGNNEN